MLCLCFSLNWRSCLFCVLCCLMIITLICIISIDGLPFRKDLLTMLSSSEAISSSTTNISSLTDLYDLVNDMLVLPLTQQALTRECNENQVDEKLETSLRLMDVCGTTKDALLKIKEDTQEVQSILRRQRGDESRMANEVHEYLSSRKMAIKAIHRSFRDLRARSSSLNSATVSILREVEGVTLTVLESLLSFIFWTKAQSKSSCWSLVSKLMNSKRVACEAKAIEVNEFEMVDATLFCLTRNKSRKLSNTNAEDAQNVLGNMESGIQDLEEGLECLLRRLIKTRVSLLNILNH